MEYFECLEHYPWHVELPTFHCKVSELLLLCASLGGKGHSGAQLWVVKLTGSEQDPLTELYMAYTLQRKTDRQGEHQHLGPTNKSLISASSMGFPAELSYLPKSTLWPYPDLALGNNCSDNHLIRYSFQGVPLSPIAMEVPLLTGE